VAAFWSHTYWLSVTGLVVAAGAISAIIVLHGQHELRVHRETVRAWTERHRSRSQLFTSA
jgi:hypothetical protein